MRGFKNFLMRGDVIVVAVGLVVALAFSTLITAFTSDLITPLINSFTGSKNGLGVEIRSGNSKTLVKFRHLHLRDHRFRHPHGRGVLPHRGAVQDGPGPARANSVR